MPSVVMSSLPIDRESVEQLKEKLLGLEVENEDDDCLENEVVASYDEEMDDSYDGVSTLTEVALLLDGMGMNKYVDTFIQENIDLNTFLNLTERDLEGLGVTKKKDRKIILRHLGEHKEPSEEYIVPESHTDDYQIAKNVQNHMTLIQNYCGYVECQMKKSKLLDYKVTSKETALTFFKAFAKAAIKQTELIKSMVFQQDSSDHLIGMLLEGNSLVLPEDLKEKLVSRKIRRRKHPYRLVGLVGLSVLLVFAARKLLKKIIN